MVLVKQYMIKLRTILLYDKLYYFLLLITSLYAFIFIKNYQVKEYYDINNNSFILKVKNYKIDGDKLNIEFNNLIGIYYFKNIDEKNNFNINIGDKLYVKGLLTKPSNNTISNTFNYKQYLYYKKINYVLNIKEYKLLNINKNIFNKIKNYIINRINKIENNEYLYAFILGKSNYINSVAYTNYKVNGITHLFALSGLHVSLFSSFILFIFKKIKLNEKISYILTSLFLLLFSFVASFTPSILRATIFFILSSINNIYYFYIKPKNLLFLTFVILELINPFYVYDTGFILSFTITLFILIFNENIKINNSIISILMISLLSLLSSLPIIINNSYEINILGFINNLFFIPFVSYLIFPMSLVVLLFSKLNCILLFLTNIMEYISKISSKLLNITLIISKLSVFEIIIYYVLFILLIKYRKKLLYLVFLLYLIFIYIKPYFTSDNYIYFLDVSQGDSTLLVFKNKSILIDTGGKIKNNKEKWKTRNRGTNLILSSIVPFFKSIGIRKIDYLIITHGDYDHMGEAINLVENFKVEKVIFNCGEFNDLESELIKVLDKKKIPYYSCIKELDIDDNKLYFLQTKEYDNENDNSNVIYTEIDGYKFMFMGDAGIDKEKDVLEKYNISDIDVLKVGHHGSKTSSSEEFINEINPKYSIISVGKNNRYGHPNKEVLNNLEDSKIYRTDQDGSIMFKIKNNKLQIETCSP